MSNSIVTKVIDEMNDLPNELQQQVLTFVVNLRQEYRQNSNDAWDILESMTGTIEAPADWSVEHDHYLYGTPKHQEADL
ncbi:hypothetical protein [Almyronema epifaneia]|uniref:DUF2281 domain-containing protein n=1 Tax=Almyronema epifaneia S1 TaxID=2991925 RepID=A0ABW6IAF8_9CYAN